MKVTTFGKFGVTLGAAALLCSALVVPAHADPASGFPTLAGFGSDTTQDVMNGVAAAIGGNKIASYNSVGSTTVKSRAGGVDVPRASSSGAGLNLLQVATGKLATASVARATPASAVQVGPEVIGQIDFARSSSSAPAVVAGGAFTNIPFAKDAVGLAYSSSLLSQVPFIVGTAASADSTTPSLYNIYRGTVKYVYFNGSTYHSAGATSTVPSGATVAYKLQPLLPASGSGTRSYFLGQLGFIAPNADRASWVADNFASYGVLDTTGNAPGVGDPIQEHKGAAIVSHTTSTTLAIAPFSIAQWVAQGNDIAGVTDGRAGVELAGLAKLPADTRVPAVTGSEATQWATNPAYAAMVRDVFNIVPSRLADQPGSAIREAFVGPNSLVCQQSATITKFGFLLMPGTDPLSSNTCGYIGYDNDAGTAVSSSTTALNVPSTVVAGSPIAISASVTSIHNGGGTVYFSHGSTEFAAVPVAFGATTATTSYTPAAAGTVAISAQFVPTLSAVVASPVTSANVTVTAPVVNTPPTSTPAAPTASTTVVTAPALTVGKSAAVSIAVTGNTSGGTVTLSDGATVLGTAAVAAGATTATVSFVPTKLTYSFTAAFAPTGSTVLASTSAAVAVKAAKGAATVKIAKIKTVTVGKKAKVTVTVSSTAGVPTGTVTIKEGKKTLASKAKLRKGKVTVSIAKLKKGTHKLTVTYNGSTILKTAKKTGSLKIK